MKTKIKRYSRSVLSVLLSVCILMSCMAVGIVGTEAAKTDEEAVGYGNSCRVKGSWDSWTLHELYGTSFSVTLAGNTDYSFVYIADNNDQFSSSATISTSISNYNFSRNDNDAITLHTGAAGTYTFTFNGFDGGQTSMSVSIAFPAEATWTVVGECGKSANTTNLFGTAWAPTATANDMTKSGSTYSLTKKYVYLTATDTISYKVAQNHAFTTTYPSANATFSFSGLDYPTGYYDATFTFNENTHAVSLTLTPSTMYTLTVPTVANAVVTATYGTATAQEGGTLSNLPPGAKVTVTITPDTGYMTDTVTASDCTVAGSNNSRTITLPTTAATSSTASKTFAVTMKTIGTKRLYFNNNASEYNMVSAYVQRYSDGYEPFGVYPGATMTKMPNSDIWYIDIPEDCDQVIFTGDNGQNTGTTPLTISTSYNPPMYTAGPDKANPNSNSTWGKYYERHNEYTVSKGSTLNNSNLFTGIKATFYDYYTDGELSGISAGGNDTSTSDGWLKGIANDEFTWRENGWKWNPYTVLNSALSQYNRNISNSATYNNTTYGLYFGNLNVTTGSNPLDMDNTAIGRGNSTTIKGYTGWNQNANGSVSLSDSHNAATGLSGLTLARGQIHHYKSANTNQNGMDMGMFNEDFLSGWNNANKPLATILRSPVFPVSQRTTNTLILDISSASATWGSSGAVMGANFHNGSTTSGNLRIPMTSLGNGKWSVSIPSGYSQVEWLRLNPSDLTGNAWNYKNAGSFGSNNKYTFTSVGTDWNTVTGSWSSDATYKHTYYEYDSTDGKDNAYITNISKSGKTAQLNYYNNSNKVYSANNAAGFFPFDFNDLNSHANPSSTTTGDISHDLGFGMKLEIPFTLEANGTFSDGMHQVFEFSGDDDLWVFVDDHLVLDLGGSHARTEGTIDFATRTVTATQTQTVGASSRNGSFASWFDNSDPDAVHTMTIYYLERGMYDSNLKFGFSFHAIPNQLKTEKKVRTANINQGFFVDNATTRSDLWIDNRTDHQVTWFEKAFRNDDFIITHKLNGTLISGKDYTLTRNRYVGSSAPATTYTNTPGTVTDGTYKLHNDDVAYFKGVFNSGALMTISESDDNTGGHFNQFEYDETVDVYDDANVDSNNNSYRFTTVSGTPTVAGTVSGDANSGASFLFSETASTGIENLNIRTRFTNQMQSHDLRITKVSNVPNDTTDFTVNVKFNFDNQEAGVQQGYIAYPLWCEKIATDGTSSSVQLSATGDATLKPGEILVIPKVPENARVQVSETLATSSDYACTSIKIYDASGNVLDFHEGASSSTSGTNVTKSQSFTVGDYDMVAEVNNEVADPVTITHSLHPDSTGTGTCTVTAQVQTSGGSVRATYPDSGTTDRVTVPATYIKRGSTDKLVITLNTAPDSPATLEDFYEALNTTIAQLVATGTDYTAVINKASNTATITVNVAALFDSTTNVQKYTTLPFYSKLDLPTYDFNITKTTNVTTTETFDFEVYKKTGLVYEKITEDPGFTFSGSGTGTFSAGTLTLSPGKTATFTATHGDIYKVIEVPKGTTVFDYNADGSSVSPTSGSYAVENGFEEITVTGNTMVTLANKNRSKTINLKKVVDYTYSADPTFPVTVEYYTGSTWATVGTYNVANDGTETSVTLTGAAATAAIKVTEISAGTNYDSSLTAIKVNDGTATTGMSKEIGVPADGDVVTINNYAKKANVSIIKALTGSITGDNTAFPITVKYTVPGGTEQTVSAESTTLKGGESYTLSNLPVGTTIKVSEGITAGYTQGTTTYSGVTYDSSTDVYTVTAAGGSITVNNSRDTHSFTIKKETDINNTSDEFKIKVYTKDTSASASADWVQYTDAIPTNKSGVTNRTAASGTGEYTITKDETLTITGLKANTQVKVVESGYGSPKYAYNNIAPVGSDSDFAETVADRSATTTLNADKGMVITNNVQTTSVTINKVVTGGVTGANVDFPLSVKVTNEKTGDTTTTYTCGSNTLTNGAANANVKIKGGQTLTIANVPIGATVEVEELSLTGLTPTFNFTSIDAADANITDEAKTGQKVSFKTANASAAAVTVTNAIATHNVTITKALTNSSSAQTFPMAVTIAGTTKTSWNYKIGDADATTGALPASMSIASGKSIVIYDVPEGASVTVTENVPTGFTCQSIVAKESTSSDIIDSVNGNNTLTFTTPADDAIVTVTNKINNKTFTVEKVTDSGDGSGFGIKVEYKLSNSSTWVNYAGSGFTDGVVTLAHNGTASVTVPSDAEVRITETTVTSGYQFVSISDGTNTYTTNGKEFAGNAIANGDTITVNNRKLYQVTIKKNLTSSIANDPAKFTFNYSYTDKDGNEQSGTSTAIGHNETFNLPHLLPAGTQVTITENATAGYTNTGSTVTANISKNGNVYTVNGEGTITFNNSLNTKTIQLKKNVDVQYSTQTTFPVKVQYYADSQWNDFGTYNLPSNGTPVSVTLTGVAATAKINVVETSVGANYNSSLTSIQINSGAAVIGMSRDIDVPNADDIITINNYAIKKNVKISKTADYVAAGAFGFTFTEAADGYKYQKYLANGTATGSEVTIDSTHRTFTLTSGQYIIVKNLPVNKTFVVEETEAQGATTTSISYTGVTGTTSGTEATFTVQNINTEQSVAFTNSQDKKLTIKKTIIDNDIVDTSTPFYISVTLGGNPFTGTRGSGYTINNANSSDTGERNTNGKIKLYPGEEIEITAQQGDIFTVVETDINNNYQFDSVLIDGTSSTTNDAKSITIGTTSVAVEYKNKIKRQNVTVSKNVTNYDSDYDVNFPITATITKPGKAATTQPGSIKHGGSFVINNLPVGTTITVAETVPDGFTRVADTSANIGKSGDTYTVNAANGSITVNNTLNTKTIKLQKAVVGWENLPATTFPVKVQYFDNNSEWQDYTTVNLSTDGTVQNVVLKGVAATARIQVIETISGANANYCDSAQTTIKVGSAAAQTGTSYAFNSPDNNTTVVITNYAKLVSVTVEKQVTNNNGDTTRFPITANITYPDGTTATATSADEKLADNENFVISDLPYGTTITVTETVPAGYTRGNDTYTGVTVSSGTYTVGSTNGTITVNNTMKTKTLKIKKEVDFSYSNETTFPISVQYYNGTSYVAVPNAPTTISNSGEWATVTLNGVAAVSKIKVTETLPSNTHYDATLTASSVANATKVDGESSGSAIVFTSTDSQSPEVTFNNYAKKIAVTVKKVITNFVTGDTTSFPITATYKRPGDASATTVGPNSLAHNGTFSVGTLPVGTEITVTENLSGISGYTQGTTEYTNGLSEDSGTYIIKTDASGEQTITVNNRRDTAGFTIKKVTDVNNTADSFKIKIWTSPNGTDWTAYTSAIGSFTADTNNEYTIHKNSELTVEGLMANTYIKVQETNGMTSKYTSTVTGFTGTTLETGSNDTTGIVKIGGTGQGINITNTTIKKDIIINKNVLHFANSTDVFKVDVLLNSEEATSKTYSYIGDVAGTITNGTTKTGIELKNGETITIKDVPIGTTVTVTEQAPTGRYEFVDIDTANANVTTPATTSTRSEVFVINDTANNAVVTIKNDVKTHDVVITKSINNSDNDTSKFKISATVQPLGASDTAQNSWDRQIGTGTRATGTLTDMEITNGQSITIYGVPVDAKVTVTEGATANFTAVSVNGTAGNTANFIMPDENKNVAVVNKINNKQVVIKKVVEGEASNTDTFPIKVEVKANTSGAQFVAYTDGDFDANGKILLAADNTDGVTVTVPLDAQVKVTELTSDAQMPTGYTIDKITLNSGTTDVRTDNSYTYTDQQNGTVTVHNKRVQGSIKVTKKISGDKYLDPDFAITVTYQRPADSEPQTHTFTVKGNGDSSGLFELPYGTVVSNVSEASVAGYKLVDTDPIQYKVNDGTAQAFGSGFTVTNQPVEIIVTNELTKHTVTIQKEVVNASNESITDSTDFTVSYKNGSADAQTGTINKGNDTKITVNNVPYGTTFTVSENTIPRGYALKSITGNGNVTVTGNTNITVTNTKLPTYSVKVTKNVDGAADATKFGVRVQTDGTPYTYAVNGGTATTVNNGAAANVELADTEYVIVSGLLEGEKLTVTETNDGAPNYSFDKFTVNGVDEAGTEKSYEYTVTNDNAQNIIVNNKEAAKYQYEVTYKYEGYSATTYNSDGTPKEGPHRFFKASGELSAADWNGYFGADGNAFVSDAAAMTFFSKTAPYEDDFMMDMEFKPEEIENMNVDRTNRKVTFEVTATTDPNRTVYVYFQLPYNVDANLVATADNQYKTTNQQHEATTQYGNWVKPHGSFVSAPLTLQGTDGTHYFQYWQIRSTTAESGRNKGKVETNYKKCFYADFNMTMYQDSYVTAVYTTDTTDYDPSTRSYQDTKDGEARINFIENSRNQWNSDGAPDLSGADKQKAGDRIYSDFLLTFGYQDLQLNTLNSTNIKTGFVVEKVAELDTGTSGYETKTQSEYHQNDKYGSSETDAKTKVVDMVKTGKTTDTGVEVKSGVTSSFIMNSNINLNQLDNKNQMKYSLNMKNKEYATNGEPTDPYRNYVFRAYTYIKNGDKVVVSDPTYFTIYDMASIEPQA